MNQHIEEKRLYLKRRLIELRQRLISPKQWTQGEIEINRIKIKSVINELIKIREQENLN